MKRILHLKSSVQGDASYSVKLGNAIVEKIQHKYAGSTVEELNLAEMDIPHLDPDKIRTLFTPRELLSAHDMEANRLSDELIERLFAADFIVIGAPLINFTIPSPLKAWIDLIARPKITFSYSQEGQPIGLVKGKKVYVAMSSGGVYSEGPGKDYDFVAPYLKAFLAFLGMTDLEVYRAEGLKVPGIMENAMEKAVASIDID